MHNGLDTFGRKRKLNKLDAKKESAMAEGSASERRAIRRFNLQLPVIVNVLTESGDVVQTVAETRDVSSHGICFYSGVAMELRTPIEFAVTLPVEVTMTEPINVRCRGTVVRVETIGDGKFAIAAAIENYEFVASDEKQILSAGGDPAAAL
jgi:hypothetical protein